MWHSSGQGLVEYSFIVLFIVLVVVLSLTLFGSQLAHIFSGISNAF